LCTWVTPLTLFNKFALLIKKKKGQTMATATQLVPQGFTCRRNEIK
jgi:hypothetical protein